MKKQLFLPLLAAVLVFAGAGCVDQNLDLSTETFSGVVEGVGQVAGELKATFENIKDDVVVEEEGEAVSEYLGWLEREGETTMVFGNDFSFSVPETWIVTSADDKERLADGRLFHGLIENEIADDAYGDPDVASINVIDVSKEQWTYEQAVEEYGWNEDDKSFCLSMDEWFSDPDDVATEEDIQMGSSEIMVGELPAQYSYMRSEKPCFIEGPAKTYATYVIEGEEVIYLITISNATSELTEELMEAAEEVVETFSLR